MYDIERGEQIINIYIFILKTKTREKGQDKGMATSYCGNDFWK